MQVKVWLWGRCGGAREEASSSNIGDTQQQATSSYTILTILDLNRSGSYTSTAVAASLGFFTRFSFFVVSLRFFASSATLSMRTCRAAAQRATTSWLSCLTMACRCRLQRVRLLLQGGGWAQHLELKYSIW